MCVVSYVGNIYLDRFTPKTTPWETGTAPLPTWPNGFPNAVPVMPPGSPFPLISPVASPARSTDPLSDAYKKWGEENGLPNDYKTVEVNYATQEQFDELKKEVQQMRELLEKAIKYDEDHGEPHCEDGEKYKKLQQIAKIVGLDISDLVKTD